MTWLSWEVVGGVAAVIAVIVALPPMWTAIQDLFTSGRRARQAILDALPNPAPRSWMTESASDEDPTNYFLENGLEMRGLETRLALPAKDIQRALRSLVAEHKVQILMILSQFSRYRLLS